MIPPTTIVAALSCLAISAGIYVAARPPPRRRKICKQDERVLVIGASSGIGRSIAHEYAARGANVCVMGRRAELLKKVKGECDALGQKGKTTYMAADFTNVEDLVRLRQFVEAEWGGIDTLIVAAGVSALQPLMTVARVDDPDADATSEGITHAVEIAKKAMNGNYFGPLGAAVAFIPLLTRTSPSPSILLVSSLAAVIPAPSRTLYASTKAASLVLYQALSIEHPSICFSAILPYTVEGDFRASAVDAGPVREADPSKHGLKREVVARRCVQAIDAGEKAVFLPAFYRAGLFLYWVFPAFVEWRARKKYGFTT
ncbi:short-chain dehydrogenases/reductases (SDR) family protein [Pleurotus pulmonarius]